MDVKDKQGSNMESEFIQSLIAKYPKACNRSLTNLSVVGLGSGKENKRPQLSRMRIAEDTFTRTQQLTNWSKGLSSSQPDLLSSTNLELSSTSSAIIIDDLSSLSSSSREANSPKIVDTTLNPLFAQKRLSSARVQEKLTESRNRLNELVNKITEISRSKQNLLDIDSSDSASVSSYRISTVPLSVKSTTNIDIHSSDDEDDTAPVPTSAHLYQKLSVIERSQANKSQSGQPVTSQAVQDGFVGKWTVSDAKSKLEELKTRLAEKCSELQKRRVELDSKLKSNKAVSSSYQRTVNGVGKSTPTPVLPKLIRQPLLSKQTPPGGNGRFCAGTDSDNDSGIGLSLKASHMSVQSGIAPKLKKAGTTSSLFSPRSSNDTICTTISVATTSRKPDMEESSNQVLEDDVSSLSAATSAEDSALFSERTVNLSQHVMAEDEAITSARNEKVCKQQSMDTDSISLCSNNTNPSKSVRFSNHYEVISDKTPRLQELKQLAEESVHAAEDPTFLLDTDLNDGFGSDTDSDEELSTASSPDLVGIDPRLAQLAVSFKTEAKKTALPSSTPPSETLAGSQQEIEDLSGNECNTPKIKSKHRETFNSVNQELTKEKMKASPPKPPRLFLETGSCNGSIASSTSVSPALSNHSASQQEKISSPIYGPYSVVDASAFQSSPELRSQDGAKPKHSRIPSPRSAANALNKPPLPKTSPPSNRRADSDRNCSSKLNVNNYETASSIPNSIDLASESDSGRQSRGRTKSPPTFVTHSKRSASNSNIPTADISSARSMRGRAASCDDLWGSNASLSGSPNNGLNASSSSLSGSRSSLFERVGSFKQAAKNKMKSLKRSLSLDRLSPKSENSKSSPPSNFLSSSKTSNQSSDLNSPSSASSSSGIPVIKKSLSWKTLNRLKFSKKSNQKVDKVTGEIIHTKEKKLSPKKAVISSPSIADVEAPNHFRPIGKLLQIYPDESRLIQLTKPPHGTYGFYVGDSANRQGVFITRLSDSYAEKLFCGLMSVGDEVLSVNNRSVSQMSIDDISDIISSSRTLELCLKSGGGNTEEWF